MLLPKPKVWSIPESASLFALWLISAAKYTTKFDVLTHDCPIGGTRVTFEVMVACTWYNNEGILYYAHTEELFDILHETHLKIEHGGRTRMEKELQT